jgi:hypothetical protein
MGSFFEYSGAERLEVAAAARDQEGMEWLAEMARQILTEGRPLTKGQA